MRIGAAGASAGYSIERDEEAEAAEAALFEQ